jgi:serine/threonine protein kinase/tetratricopeptide (TPR) repeat protein
MNAHGSPRVPLPGGRLGADGLPLTVLAEGFLLKGAYRVSYMTTGGMGTVYSALTLDDRPFIVKEVSQKNAVAVIALNQEKATLDRLSHPGIVRVEELFVEGDYYYLVVEHIEGEDLQKRIHPGTTEFLEETAVLEWARQLFDIFEYLHSQTPPIIYRDLKPQNILLDDKGLIRLIDFGIARVYKQFKDSDTIAMGTLVTASPEHFGEGQTDIRSDIYTIGATLYFLLTNNRAKRKRLFDFPPLLEINPAVSENTVRSIEKAVMMNPEERFQSIAEMREALMTGSAPRKSEVSPPGVRELQRNDGESRITNLLPPETKELSGEGRHAPRKEEHQVPRDPMTCSGCGTENPHDSSFCEFCGTAFEKRSAPGKPEALPSPGSRTSSPWKTPVAALLAILTGFAGWMKSRAFPFITAHARLALKKIKDFVERDSCERLRQHFAECFDCVRGKKPISRPIATSLIIMLALIAGIAAMLMVTMSHSPRTTEMKSGDEPAPQAISRLMEEGLKDYKKNRYAEAEMHFQKVVKLDPQYLESYWYIGQCREKRDHTAEALRAYRKYVLAIPEDVEKTHHIARLLINSRDYKKALEIELAALKTRETAEGFSIIGSCHYFEGNYDKALASLNQATTMDMNHAPSFELLARCYARENKFTEARSAAESAYKLKPEKSSLLYDMATYAGRQNDLHGEKEYLKRYIAVEKNERNVSEASCLLKQVTARAMKSIPHAVEKQNDTLPGLKVMGLFKFGDRYSAHVSVNGAPPEEYHKGETLLSSYYILDINEERMVLTRDENYFVLKTK